MFGLVDPVAFIGCVASVVAVLGGGVATAVNLVKLCKGGV